MGLICLLYPLDDQKKLRIDIGSNALICDCKDFNIISMNRHFFNSHRLDRANCEEPMSLYKEKVSTYI